MPALHAKHRLTPAKKSVCTKVRRSDDFTAAPPTGLTTRRNTVSIARPKKPARSSRAIPQPLFTWLLIAPSLALFAVFNILPLLWLVGLSFFRYNLTLGLPPQFVGFKNYIDLMNDRFMWGRLGLTLLFVALAVGIETILGALLGYAFWKKRDLPGRRLALTLLFVPMVLAPVAVGTFFKIIYDPMYGVLPYYTAHLLRIKPPDLLGSGSLAFPAVLAVDVWMWTPFLIMMTVAALGAVPKALLESAEIDGLTAWQRLRYVIWPKAKFVLMLGVVLRTIDAFKTFDLVSAMTAGGPGNQTQLISLTIFREAFNDFTIGKASALSLLVLFIAISLASIYLFVLNYGALREQG
jgi:multiple sugar transport system permease protein